MELKLEVIDIVKPENVNCILGQSHFIKTVEDIHEALVTTFPDIKFGLAFVESSGPRLIRSSGTDKELENYAKQNAMNVGAGHFFIILLGNAYPINVIHALRTVPEIVTLFAASANPLQVIVAETDKGRAVLGVVDGGKPLGFEKDEDIKKRKEFLRKIGYKF